MRLGMAAALAVAAVGLAGPARAQSAGETVFKRSCLVCHAVEPGKNKVGPSLAGVVGRKAGTVPGFAYSAANRDSGLVWDSTTLDPYLADPQKVVKGTKMAFPGLKSADDRKAVIDYLASLKS